MGSMDSFAARLARARIAAGLSQRKLSILAGLNDSHVRLLESGTIREVSLSTASALARALGVGIETLEPEASVVFTTPLAPTGTEGK